MTIINAALELDLSSSSSVMVKDWRGEMARILRELANSLEVQDFSDLKNKPLFDKNGTHMGFAKVKIASTYDYETA
jgi:hypothetical protein